MKIKKQIFFALCTSLCLLLACASWLYLRPLEIISVHKENEFSDVLVKNFPFTDKGKIKWWLKNKDMLKNKYKIPDPASNGDFSISFWLFGDGYKENDGYDRLCFNDIRPPINCIEKNAIFSVNKSKNMGTVFTVYEGTYILKENGEIVKYSYK